MTLCHARHFSRECTAPNPHIKTKELNRWNDRHSCRFQLEIGLMQTKSVCKQWLKWFCEAGRSRAHLTKPGWSKPHTHSNPTNLALFGHKTTLYRFNQEAHTIAGGSNRSRGLSPLTLTTACENVHASPIPTPLLRLADGLCAFYIYWK